MKTNELLWGKLIHNGTGMTEDIVTPGYISHISETVILGLSLIPLGITVEYLKNRAFRKGVRTGLDGYRNSVNKIYNKVGPKKFITKLNLK